MIEFLMNLLNKDVLMCDKLCILYSVQELTCNLI